jgi:hypothetical protein
LGLPRDLLSVGFHFIVANIFIIFHPVYVTIPC